jgi:hypothetical protein
MLAHSRVPHTFTYISFGYDMLTAARKGAHEVKVHRTSVQLRLPLFPISPVQHYSCITKGGKHGR